MRIIYLFVATLLICSSFSYHIGIVSSNTQLNDKILFISYDEIQTIIAQKVKYKGKERIRYISGQPCECPISREYPRYLIIYDTFRIKQSTKILLCYNSEIKDIELPYSDDHLQIHGLSDDSNLIVTFKNKRLTLKSEEEISDTLIYYLYDRNRKIQMGSSIFLKNYGLFSRDNIFTTNEWYWKQKEEQRIKDSIEMDELENFMK